MSRAAKPDERGLLGRVAAGASHRVLDIVDPNVVLDNVDVDGVLDRVDVNALLDRVDVDELLLRVDVNTLLDRVDIDALLARADIDALMERVNVKRLVDRAGIPDIVAESTSYLGGSALDLFRRPLVGLDEIIVRVLNRLVRRDISTFPEGPAKLLVWVDEHHGESRSIKTGRYAGPITRILAVLLDSLAVTFTFTLMAGGVTLLVSLFVPNLTIPTAAGVAYVVALVLWALTYLFLSVAIFGKTIGKFVLGLRVVSSEGSPMLTGRQASIRAISYPISFLFLGVGLWGVFFSRERRTWHDHFAGTAVVYDWGSRAAMLPTPLADFIERRGSEDE